MTNMNFTVERTTSADQEPLHEGQVDRDELEAR
jgi:hypothetical protein